MNDEDPNIEDRYLQMDGGELDADHAVVPDTEQMSSEHEGMTVCATCGLEAVQEGPDPRNWEHVDELRDDQFGPGPLWVDVMGVRPPLYLDSDKGGDER